MSVLPLLGKTCLSDQGVHKCQLPGRLAGVQQCYPVFVLQSTKDLTTTRDIYTTKLLLLQKAGQESGLGCQLRQLGDEEKSQVNRWLVVTGNYSPPPYQTCLCNTETLFMEDCFTATPQFHPGRLVPVQDHYMGVMGYCLPSPQSDLFV